MAATYEELMAKSRELFAAGDNAGAKRVAKIAISRRDSAAGQQQNQGSDLPANQPANQQSNLGEQIGSGINEGLASMLGFPVDVVTGVLNAGSAGINKLTGANIPQIENPVAGSGTFTSLLDPFTTDVQPQTTMQSFGKRIGQEVGGMAVPGAGLAAKAQRPLQMLLAESLSALGSGTAGETSRQIAPDSDAADFIASMVGGLSPIAATRGLRPAPKAPTTEAISRLRDEAYERVRNSGATITPQSRAQLIDGLRGRAARDNFDKILHPKSNRALEIMDELPAGPRIYDIEQKRQLIGSDVAGAEAAGERRIGVGMKKEIQDYLDRLTPADVSHPNPQSVVGDLRAGRANAQKVFKATEIDGLVEKGQRRASSSGSGGNIVNAIRQKFSGLLENPKKRRGYSAEEISAMEEIARGNFTTNSLRNIGKLSPTSGALPLIGNIAGVGVGGTPAIGAMGAAFLAKGAAEQLTKKQVDRLSELVRNGAPLDPKRMSEAERGALAALLAQRVSYEKSQSQ